MKNNILNSSASTQKPTRTFNIIKIKNENHNFTFFTLAFLIFLFFANQLPAQENQFAENNAETRTPIIANIQIEHLVEIPRLSSYDMIFTQFSEEVERNSMRNARGLPADLMFYRYNVKKDETLFTISARCSIPYEAIATLNAISSPIALSAGMTLVLPNAAGLFVFDKPKNSIEILVAKSDNAIEQNPKILYNISSFGNSADVSRNCFFMQNARFSPTARAFFLDTSLRLPLDNYWLSSSFGMRVSPISGNRRFHNGIDMAANEGTAVFACKSGIVQLTKKGDATFGNYIILEHDGGMTSLYAHLSQIIVSKGETVFGGQQIGKVGHTGLATGSHLHFEIRMNGVATDPERLLSK